MDGSSSPFRNVRGQIGGLQVRLSNPGSGPKYVWFSAGDQHGGIGQNGTICHVARPSRPTSTKRVVLTEGPIKANIAADRFNCIVLAVAGVANIAGVLPALKALGDVEDVAIAYDPDAETNAAGRACTKPNSRSSSTPPAIASRNGPGSSRTAKALTICSPGLMPFPIPHPALKPSDQADPQLAERVATAERLHSLTTQARRAPNLGAERHTLTDLALTLAAATKARPCRSPTRSWPTWPASARVRPNGTSGRSASSRKLARPASSTV